MRQKILQCDSEWNMQTSVCCIPLLKKRGTQYYEINHTGDSDFLQLPGAAHRQKWEQQSFLTHWQQCEKWMWLAARRAPRKQWGSDTNRKREKKINKKNPWRKSFTRLHIFTCLLAGIKQTTAALMSPAALHRKLQVPCLRMCDARWFGSGPHAQFQQWWNTAYNMLNLGAFYSFIQFCVYTVCTHSFHMYPTSTFSSVCVNMLSHFKISHVSHTKWDKVKYKDTFVLKKIF